MDCLQEPQASLYLGELPISRAAPLHQHLSSDRSSQQSSLFKQLDL